MTKKHTSSNAKPDKVYTITFGVTQTLRVNEAANKLNMTPNQFIHAATTEACKALLTIPKGQ